MKTSLFDPTVDEFFLQNATRLSAFRAWWQVRSAEDPMEYPPNLTHGEWEERYKDFLGETK